MAERWIKASEIGEYLYCKRAWWYRLQDTPSVNVRELALGTELHARHGRGLRLVAWQRTLAYILIAVAVTLIFVQLLG